jgi:hypothetical protein
MKYLGKQTSQLSTPEFQQISDLFSAVFNTTFTSEQLRAKYRAPSRNNSCHGLMVSDEGRITGALAIIPFDYDFFDKKAVFGCAADLMVHKNYRSDITAMKKMYDAVIGIIQNEIDFLYAVPNPNSHLYFRRILGWNEIGKLDYYALPLHVSRLSPRLKGLDIFSQSAAALLNVPVWPSPEHAIEKPIVKILTPDFINYRYPAGRYQKIEVSGRRAYYAIYHEPPVTTAYIVDVCPLSANWLSEAVRHIWRKERQNIDIILYVGAGCPGVPNLFKVPLRFEPRRLHLIGKVLNPEKIDDRIHCIKNWQFNISDLDVR